MPDRRKHRGPHPADRALFEESVRPMLRQATVHLSWLLTRSYPVLSSLKLVGDRFRLTERQRKAVVRSACSDQALQSRLERELPLEEAAGRPPAIDGFNLLTTIEAALAGGVILQCRDGCFRDMASMHGSYRKVEETGPALQLIGEVLAEFGVTGCLWYFDSPVSNSGRVSQIVRDVAQTAGWDWQTELLPDPDPRLIESERTIVSADSQVLDGCDHWLNLAAHVIRRRIPSANAIDMGGGEED